MRALLWASVVAASLAPACAKPPRDPLELEGNKLTVYNRTAEDWTDVEIWLNRYYRMTAASIPAGGRFESRIDFFVAGFGQRFDVRHARITDVRLTARGPDGQRVEIKKQFSVGGLEGAFRRKSS